MFIKPALSVGQQIELLTKWGLIIDPTDNIELILSHISYYRLSGYWWLMLADKVDHSFKEGSTLKDVISHYNFDRELRILLFALIEKIEISLRTKLIYQLSHEFGPWWFQNEELFINKNELAKSLSKLRDEIHRSKDTFMVEHLKQHKDDHRLPPSWKTLELTSFGTLSKLYGNLKPTVKSKDIIAEEYGTVNHTFLPSWLQSIAQIRNNCAHHSRLWNKGLPGRPKLLTKPPNPWVHQVPDKSEHQQLYVHLCCMKYLLDVIQPQNKFKEELISLLLAYPNVDPTAMGLKPDWELEPLWQN